MAENVFLSIITPVWNTTTWMLRPCIDSVLNQTDQDFELILVDDGSTNKDTLDVLASYKKDPRITLITRKEQGGILNSTNDGLEQAQGQFVTFLDHDDELSLDAVEVIKSHVNENPDVDFLYSDEDHISETGEYCLPFYKPDWSPERLRSHNYICHLSVYRHALLDEIGYLREGFEGSQDYDLVLRFTERTDKIVHIRRVLYHWRIHPESVSGSATVKSYAYEAAQAALLEHAQRKGWDATVKQTRPEGVYEVRRSLPEEPLISVIIPTAFSRKLVRGRKIFLLENAIRSVVQRSTYSNIEFIIVTNVGVRDNDRRAILEAAGEKPIEIVERPGAFNFSAQVNYAATFAHGSLLFMLNDDAEIADEESISRMAGFFVEPDVAMVGALLLFETDYVQHAGIVMATHGPTNYLTGYRQDEMNGTLSLFCSREVSATTFAVALIDRNAFFAVGGMCEMLPNCYNDVDCCAKILELNKRIIWTPQSVFYHYESATRDPEVRNYEAAIIRKRWGHVLEDDKYINPQLAFINNALIHLEYAELEQ